MCAYYINQSFFKKQFYSIDYSAPRLTHAQTSTRSQCSGICRTHDHCWCSKRAGESSIFKPGNPQIYIQMDERVGAYKTNMCSSNKRRECARTKIVIRSGTCKRAHNKFAEQVSFTILRTANARAPVWGRRTHLAWGALKPKTTMCSLVSGRPFAYISSLFVQA